MLSTPHRWVRPWLWHSHPMFFLVYAVTVIRHGWSAWNGIRQPDLFTGPAYMYINDFARPLWWGIGAAAVTVLMVVGLFRSTFRLARTGLAVGLFLAVLQLLFLSRAQLHGIPTGNGIPNFGLIAGLLLSQTLEPPHNPASAR